MCVYRYIIISTTYTSPLPHPPPTSTHSQTFHTPHTPSLRHSPHFSHTPTLLTLAQWGLMLSSVESNPSAPCNKTLDSIKGSRKPGNSFISSTSSEKFIYESLYPCPARIFAWTGTNVRQPCPHTSPHPLEFENHEVICCLLRKSLEILLAPWSLARDTRIMWLKRRKISKRVCSWLQRAIKMDSFWSMHRLLVPPPPAISGIPERNAPTQWFWSSVFLLHVPATEHTLWYWTSTHTTAAVVVFGVITMADVTSRAPRPTTSCFITHRIKLMVWSWTQTFMSTVCSLLCTGLFHAACVYALVFSVVLSLINLSRMKTTLIARLHQNQHIDDAPRCARHTLQVRILIRFCSLAVSWRYETALLTRLLEWQLGGRVVTWGGYGNWRGEGEVGGGRTRVTELYQNWKTTVRCRLHAENLSV